MELPDTPTAADTLMPDAPATASIAWTPVTRFFFRIAFLYFASFVLLGANGGLFEAFPVVGGWIEGKLSWPLNHLSEFAGQHLFHLTGLAAHWHPSESGDTMMNWIHDGLALALAIAGGILWSAIAQLRNSPRTDYRTLHAWLRFFLRLTCGMFMIGYGVAKVFPFQMPPPSVAILTEPAGNMAPMTFLWNLIGLNPVYEVICGSAEVIGGMLLLYRRTALAGAIVSAFVMTNVVLYNFCFDVPVKLFAANLLLGLLFLALPDAVSLCRFFWSHIPAAPSAPWVPPAGRRAGRIAILVTEIVFAVAFLGVRPVFMTIGWHHYQEALRNPPPLTGAWHLDATHPASGAFIDPRGLSITDLYVAPSSRAYTRASDGELWLTGVDIDVKKHTVTIGCYFINPPTNYTWQLTDPDHLVLTSVPPPPPKSGSNTKPAPAPAVLTLTRTPTPAHYPLLERGFHLVSEWRYER